MQIEVPNRGGQLLIGQTGTAVIYTGQKTRVPVVPRDAVLMESGRPYVFVQEGGESFARRYVDVASRDGDLVGIRERRQTGRARRDARRLRAAAGLGGQGIARRRPRPLRRAMRRIVQWSIEQRWIVIGLSALLFAAGAWTARRMPIDVFPDLTAPTVTILTEGHGMAPEEMESLVTFPIESAINGASDVRRVRSATAVGIAVVWVEFDWGTDIFLARQLVSEKLALVGASLPPQVERPVLAPVSSIMGEILFFAISSDREDPLALRTVADTVVRRRLLAVPGVSQVTPIGGAERQFQVIAHPEALRANDVSLNELLSSVRAASQNTSAGIYTEGAQEYVLEAVGRVRRAEDIGETVVAHARRPPSAGEGRRRGARGRRVQARRGIAQRQAGRHRRRPEAARRQHHRRHRAARPRAGHAAAGAAGRA